MLEAVKKAMGITDAEYDSELQDLIDAAKLDLTTNGIDIQPLGEDKLILQAVKTYVRMHFQSPADFDRLERAYNQQKGHLQLAKGYGYQAEESTGGDG